MSGSTNRWRSAVLLIFIVAAAVLAAARLQPIIADSQDAPATEVGVDYRTTVYGPNILVSERQNPWKPEASVPRFGRFPATPIWPVSYVAHPLLSRIGYTTGLSVFLSVSIALVIVGCGRISRSLGFSRLAALLIATLVALSPTHLYNVALGQTGVGLVAAVAYFAVRARQNPAWWHCLEKWIYAATILFLFAKPTFALTFLAANLAYERSVRVFARFAAVAASIGLVSFVSIVVRSDQGPAAIVSSMRKSSTILGNLPVNRMDGDRLDLVSLIFPSPLLDVVALVAVAAGLVLLNQLAHTTLRERLVLGIGLVTIGTYHHMYDSLPLLALMCCTLLSWPLRQALLLGIGLVVSGWLYGINVIRNAITDVVPIDFFALQARLVFLLVASAMVGTCLLVRSRPGDRTDAKASWIRVGMHDESCRAPE